MLNRIFSFSPINIWLKHNQPKLLRILIIFGVLLLSAGLAYLVSLDLAVLILVAVPAAGAILVLLRWPQLGLVFLVAASLLVPFAIGTGTQTEINISVIMIVVLLGLWIFDMVSRQRRVWLVFSGPVTSILSLCVAAILAFIAGQLPWFNFVGKASLLAQFGGLSIFLLSAGAFLLTANQVQELYWLKCMTWSFLVIGGFFIFGRLFPIVGSLVGQSFRSIIKIKTGATGSLFWVWIVALALSQAVFNPRLSIYPRILLLSLVMAVFYANFIQNRSWASGWLPPMVTFAALILIGVPRSRVWIALLGGVGIILFAKEILDFLLEYEQYSQLTRGEAFRILLEIIKVNPVLGLGPSNYYFYTPLFKILGWHVQFNSHNQYLDLVAQTGLLGLVCFTWFAWEIGKVGWQLKDKVPQGFSKAYVIGALGGLAGTLAAGLLGDWVLPFVYNIGFKGFRASVLGWIFLGGLLAIKNIYDDQSRL
jgi:hypothetical protein